MPHIAAKLQSHVEAAAPPDIELRFKPMFGGIGVYADGRMCISLSDVGLALKLGETERAGLLKLKGARPLQYEPNSPPSKSYVVVPDSMLKDRAELGRWIAISAAFVRAAPSKKPRKRLQTESGGACFSRAAHELEKRARGPQGWAVRRRHPVAPWPRRALRSAWRAPACRAAMARAHRRGSRPCTGPG